jgi:hypothetical protein
MRAVEFGAGQIDSLQSTVEALLTLKCYKAVHFVSQATNKVDPAQIGKKNLNIPREGLNLMHVYHRSYFSTLSPNPM